MSILQNQRKSYRLHGISVQAAEVHSERIFDWEFVLIECIENKEGTAMFVSAIKLTSELGKQHRISIYCSEIAIGVFLIPIVNFHTTIIFSCTSIFVEPNRRL
jgi:hypothetical protein